MKYRAPTHIPYDDFVNSYKSLMSLAGEEKQLKLENIYNARNLDEETIDEHLRERAN